MVSAILHLILSLFTVIGALVVYEVWKNSESKRQTMENFLVFFTFFAAYHLSLSLPFFLFSGNLMAMAWGYNLAIIFLFLFLVPMYKIMIFQILGVSPEKANFSLGMFLLIGFAAVIIQIYDFRLPIIDPSGFIIWNANLVSGFISFLAGSLIAIVWVIILIRNHPKHLSRIEKFKSTLFTASCSMFAVASIYFIARNLIMVYIAFITVTLGTVLMTVDFLIPKGRSGRVKQ